MAYKRDLATPLAPTFEPSERKEARKKRRAIRKSNRAIDKKQVAARKKEVERQKKIKRSGLAAEGTYSADVSKERKVKKKVANIQKKIDKVSEKKDARQKKLVQSGVRRETRKNQLLQKQVEAKRVESGKKGKFGSRSKDRIERRIEKREAKKDSGSLPEGKYKPIRRVFQKGRKYNKAIRKGTGIGVNNKTTRKKRM